MKLLEEQIAYYRAIAPEYEEHSIPGFGDEELVDALDAFHPSGRVLELACGPGAWTERLLRDAASVTVVDASPEMLARTRARVGDRVFFGFWLSHVPMDHFESFWSLVSSCLEPTGRIFFFDDAYRTPDELIEGESSSTIRCRLKDGTSFRAVKVPHRPADLETHLQRLGWRITVTQTSGPAYWGAGTKGHP